MHILGLQWRRLILAAMVFLICRVLVVASDEPTLSKEQIQEFLLTAKVVRSQQSKKGITNPWRLTLTDGTINSRRILPIYRRTQDPGQVAQWPD